MMDRPDSLRILILNKDLPVFPGWGGIEYLHTTRLAQLAQKVGLVSLVHTREQQEKNQALADAGVTLYLWENPNLKESQSIHRARSSFVLRVSRSIYNFVRTCPTRRPQDTLISDLMFRNMSAAILKALCNEHWQVLVVVQSNCARWLDYLPRLPVNVLVMHDVRALVYQRQARVAGSLAGRLACLLEAWFCRRFERKYCHKYDLIVTVSSADEAWVREHYQPNKLVTIPIPVDGGYFKSLPSIHEAPAQILFTGMMNHLPNVDAACFFARQVFPRVKSAVPEAEFWIVGRDPSPEVVLLNTLPGVVVTGYVPDIRPYIAKATLFVVPLRFGAGTRQKILEAWAMQKCVVSTKIGAEGLDYQDRVNILIADDAQTLADRVIEAIRDPLLRDRIRVQGHNLITRQHHPDQLAQKYYQAIASVVRKKRRHGEPLYMVIDLRWMRPGVAGGIENLSRSFLNQLLQLDNFNRYTILMPAEVRHDFDMRGHENFRISVTKTPRHYWRWLVWRGAQFLHRCLKKGYWRSSEVESLLRTRDLNADIALSIPGYIHPDLYPLTNVLIVPDIQHEYYPEFFLPHHLEERRRIYTDSIKRADHICAISEFTRQTLIERLDVPPERVSTAHLAADPLFHPQSIYRGYCGQVLKKYGLKPNEYLLFPGNTWPHKNHRTAFHALHILREAYHLEPLLVCTGSPKEAHSDLLQMVHELQLDDRVKFLGYCPTSDMPALYEGAAALVFPSLFEGFGIPLLEAMWCDCPVVCSNATSLPEIAGDAALLFDPHSPEELAAALSRILTDDQLRRALINHGHQQAKKFSWRNFTMKISRVLRECREMVYL
jgi:glycosyltransferase involved in cell wall biosynthesis